jgi:hypothetical protein
MKKLLLLSLLLITGCNKTITKDQIDIAKYFCNVSGEELHLMEVEYGTVRFQCGGIEGEWLTVKDAILREGTACILEN